MSNYTPQKSKLEYLIEDYIEALMGFYGYKNLSRFKDKHPEILRSFDKIKTDSNIENDKIRINMATAYYRTVRDLCLDYN